jgi:hypothetical protein
LSAGEQCELRSVALCSAVGSSGASQALQRTGPANGGQRAHAPIPREPAAELDRSTKRDGVPIPNLGTRPEGDMPIRYQHV